MPAKTKSKKKAATSFAELLIWFMIFALFAMLILGLAWIAHKKFGV